MKRTIILITALLFASALPAPSQETDQTALLLQRVASQLGGKTEVAVGTLPAGMPNVPLPDATIIGGVRRTVGSSSNPLYIYDVFYQAGPETLKAYAAALSTGGWTFQPQIGGGFVSSGTPTSRMFCKTGASLLIVHQGASPEDLRVTVDYRSEDSDLMCRRSQPEFGVGPMQTSVPSLYAPQGVTMDTSGLSSSGDAGESSARISKGSSAGALLDNFASQMTAAGWKAGGKLTGKGLASQTFTKLDNPKYCLQSVILVSAMAGQPGNFVAILDVEHL
ncbi:MAG TPA: hypothetical protein VF741_01435 [Candidatus Aquilonibacter sp.]